MGDEVRWWAAAEFHRRFPHSELAGSPPQDVEGVPTDYNDIGLSRVIFPARAKDQLIATERSTAHLNAADIRFLEREIVGGPLQATELSKGELCLGPQRVYVIALSDKPVPVWKVARLSIPVPDQSNLARIVHLLVGQVNLGDASPELDRGPEAACPTLVGFCQIDQ
jgi:hypothetical protein